MPSKYDISVTIPSGSFRHTVSIVTANTGNTDSYGTPQVNSTVVLANVRASIASTTSLSYRELVTAQSISSSVTDLVIIRYPGDDVSITPGMTVNHGNNAYSIQAVDNVLELNRYLNLMCKVIDKSSDWESTN